MVWGGCFLHQSFKPCPDSGKELAFFILYQDRSKRQKGKLMKDDRELVLKVTKEIVIKFIETGRISPNSFNEIFHTVYEAIDETLKDKREKNTKE